jgi:carbon storage regulator
MVGDDLMVTVAEIDSSTSNMVAGVFGRALIVVYRRVTAGRSNCFEEFTKAWLDRDQQIPLGDNASCTLVDVRPDGAVRLGLIAPKEMSVHRTEVYEAIRRENRRRPDDDGDFTVGSPVPKPDKPPEGRAQAVDPT